jgi:hypothetical protein
MLEDPALQGNLPLRVDDRVALHLRIVRPSSFGAPAPRGGWRLG